MTAPPPSNLYNPPGSSIDRTSGSTPPRPQQAAWGSSLQSSGRRPLAPLSTSTSTHSARSGGSQSPRTQERNPWSPTVAGAGSARQATRSSSIASSANVVPPSPSSQQQALLGSLLSAGRTKPAGTPTTSQHSTSSQAQGGSGNSSFAGSKNIRASPSLTTTSFGSPNSFPNPALQAVQSGSLSKIAFAQISLLLSTMKEDKDGSKANQVMKLVSENGTEVFTKYFRRLLLTHAAQIFSSNRNVDNAGSYPLLVAEVQKVTHDPARASLIVEAVDLGDNDIFRDFDLSSFMEHFKMNSFVKVTLASAFKKATKSDLRMKADAILANNLTNFLATVANPPSVDTSEDDYSPLLLASIIDRLAQNPPRNWNDNTEQSLYTAIQQRYHNQGMLVPVEVSSAMAMFGLLHPANALARLLKSHGPRSTETVAACKALLDSADPRDISYQQVASALLFVIIAKDEPTYHAGNLIFAIREHSQGQRLEWQDVIRDFDREGIKVTKPQFKRLFDALMPLAQDYENFDLQLLWGGEWHQEETQLAFVTAFVSHNEDELDAADIPRLRRAFVLEDFEDASEDVQAYAQKAVRHPLVSVDATKALFNIVFRSSETYMHAQNFGVVDNVINANMDLFVSSVSAVPKPWSALQDQAIKQLVASFFWKAVSGRSFALHILWKRDSAWLAQRLTHYYQQKPIQLDRILDLAQEHGWMNDLISLNNELSLDLAAVAHGRGIFDLETWLQQMAQAIRKDRVVSALSQYLRAKAEDDLNAQRDKVEHVTVPLTIRTVNTILDFLGSEGLAEEERTALLRICIQAYPRLINYGEGFDHIIDTNGRGSNALAPEVDAKMQEHYKLMYSGHKEVRQVIEDLQRYKTSEDAVEQDLFVCMIFGLFDEYHCFGEYPLDALATTAVLFGSIINYKLLSRVALQVAISMVLDAIKDSQPHESMYKFGLQALLHFQERLEEWQALTRVLIQIQTLQGTPIYPLLEKIVRDGQLGSDGTTEEMEQPNGRADDFLALEPKYPEFNCLSVDPPSRLDFFHQPDEQIEESVLFNLNNVSERNLTEKTLDLKTRLQEEHFQWFAKFLVESRIKAQPNYHQLYMSLLQEFNNSTLWAEVLRETYVCVVRMLNAETTMNSSNERAHLKNLGAWLGSMTLARNQAVKYRNISFKDLLIEAHDTSRLLVAIPFTCKVMSYAADSLIFRPPSAWTMEIIYILIELYQFADLKLNLKFEIEVLCKALDLDHKELEPADVIRSRPTLEDELLRTGLTDGMDGFGSEMGLFSGRREMAARFSPSNMIPDLSTLSNVLKHNYSLPSSVTAARVRQLLSVACERAVAEIIGPVVERSVTIAAISASQLIAKDFALEVDVTRYREAAHVAVRNMAGSLAGVTCKEPLRASMANHIQLLRQQELSEQQLPQGSILMFINDNLDAVCGFVETAAEDASTNEIDVQIEDGIQARKNGTYVEPQVSNWAYFIPAPYRPMHGGLNSEQLAIYSDFGRSIRPIAHANNLSQDSGRQMDMLQDQYAMGGLPSSADLSNPQDVAHPDQLTPSALTRQLMNGGFDNQPIARFHELVRHLYQAAHEADNDGSGVPLTEARAVNDAWTALREAMASASPVYKYQAALNVAGEIATLLRSEPQKVAIVEVFARIMASLCLMSEDTAKSVHAWCVNLLSDRPYNAGLIIGLVRYDLIDLQRLDLALMRDLQHAELETIRYFGDLADGLLLNEPPTGLRADFARSMHELTRLATDAPELSEAQALLRKLHDSAARAPPGIDKQPSVSEAQIEYIFEEWVRLQEVDPLGATLIFIHQVHVKKVLKSKDDSASFFRACVDSCILAFEQEEMKQNGSIENAYVKTDALAKLVVFLVEQHGKADDSMIVGKAGMLGHILTLLALILAFHYKHRGDRFNSKVFFRLFSSILYEIYASPALVQGNLRDLLLAFGRAMLMLAPQTFPGFAFAWLSLHSHRMFMPALLRFQDDDAAGALYCDLISRQLAYTGDLMYAVEITIAAQEYYRGALKLLLVLHHDFPEYLAEYHNEILKSVPAHCTQLRSLVVSACPTSLHDLPDPFTEGLKVDRIEDMKRAPIVRGDKQAPLAEFGLDRLIDSYVGASNDQSALESIVATINSIPGPRLNALLNCLVLYMLRNLEANNRQRNLAFSATSPQARLLDYLVDKLHPEQRYNLINAVANQLRYPNTHTHYFMYAMLHLFRAGQTDQTSMEIQEQITRVFAERIIVHRPHPWGLMVTLIELLKNRTYRFWDLPFVKAAPDLERMFSPLLAQMRDPARPIG